MRQAILLGDALGFAYGPVVNPDQNTPTCWGRPGESHHPPTPHTHTSLPLQPNPQYKCLLAIPHSFGQAILVT